MVGTTTGPMSNAGRATMLERLKQHWRHLDEMASDSPRQQVRHVAGANAETVAWAISVITEEAWPPPGRGAHLEEDA